MSELLELNDFCRENGVKKLYCLNAVSYTVLAILSKEIILILYEAHLSIGGLTHQFQHDTKTEH